MAGWDLAGSFDRSLDRLRIRNLAGQGTAVGYRNLHRNSADCVVAVGSCFLQDLVGYSRSQIVLGGRADTVDRPGHWNRGKTVRGHGLDRCRRKVAGKMVEVMAGNLAEANYHILANREKNTGRIEEVAVHVEVPAVHTKAPVLGSSPDWRLGCSHSCCLQRNCLGVDTGSCLLFSVEDTSVLLCCVGGALDFATKVEYGRFE